MSFQNFLTKNYKQTAVYWGNPQDDGYGGKTYDDAVEINCRWEDKQQLMADDNGEQLLSRSIVFTNIELDYNGLFYNGSINDLDSDEIENPRTIENICIIRRVEKTPYLGSTTVFLRKAFLTPWLS